MDLASRNPSTNVGRVGKTRVLNGLRSEPPDPLLQSASGLVTDVLAGHLNELVEILRSIRDLIVHLPGDLLAGLGEVGDDRVRPKLFPAVPVEPDPPARHIDGFETVVCHGIAPGSSLAQEALYASTSVFRLGGWIYQAGAQKSTARLLAFLNKELMIEPRI